METQPKTQTIGFGGNVAAFSKGLKNNAMIRRGAKLFLIDLSQENFAAYRDHGMFNDVKEVHLVITHTHGDHASGLGDMGLYSFFSIQPSFKKKFFVYAPAAIAADVQSMLRIMGCTNAHYDFTAIEDTVSIDSISFTCIEVDHVPMLRCFAYIIEIEGKRIYFSGDANMIPQHILSDLKTGEFDEFYQDVCIAEYPGNVHLPLSMLTDLVPPHARAQVFCMHLDHGFPIEEAMKRGFNMVETLI